MQQQKVSNKGRTADLVKKYLSSQQLILFIVLLIFAGVFAMISPAFRSFANIQRVSVNISITLIIALVMNLLMISGGVDLSVGSVMAFSACTMAALTVQQGITPVLSIILGLMIVMLVGLTNGFIITKLKLEPLIVTLGMMIIIRGLSYVVTRYFTIQLTERFAGSFFIWLGRGRIFGIPFIILFAALVFVICYVIQNRTVVGRNLYFIGGKESVARLSGIKVDKTKIIFYVATALAAGISGLFVASLVQSAQPVIGQGMEFRAITAILVGGTSLGGGRGNVVGTLLGAVLVGIVFNAATILGLPFFVVPVIEGSIIIVAALTDAQIRKHSETLSV